MSGQKVVRPVVRSFTAKHEREAGAHVRAGGHAVVWDSPGRARLVVPLPKKGDVEDLGYWSLLDLGRSRYRVVKSGALRGLAWMRVPSDCNEIVRRRAERDSVLEGPTHALILDCLACGACCRDNRVVLDDDDVARFRRAGRADLTKPPYARRASDGRLVLTLRKDKACRHLGRDNRCGIYELRPEACSSFPMGSECCLYSREEELGITDGLTAADAERDRGAAVRRTASR
jgi:Fe-S-cluster containining protein